MNFGIILWSKRKNFWELQFFEEMLGYVRNTNRIRAAAVPERARRGEAWKHSLSVLSGDDFSKSLSRASG